MIEWLNISEAEEYYKVNRQTLHKWRKDGSIRTKDDISTSRVAYLYEKNESWKSTIDEIREHDARYTRWQLHYNRVS